MALMKLTNRRDTLGHEREPSKLKAGFAALYRTTLATALFAIGVVTKGRRTMRSYLAAVLSITTAVLFSAPALAQSNSCQAIEAAWTGNYRQDDYIFVEYNDFLPGEQIYYYVTSSGTTDGIAGVEFSLSEGGTYNTISAYLSTKGDEINLSGGPIPVPAGGISVYVATHDVGATFSLTMSCSALSSPPVLTSVTPNEGSTAGGMSVTLTGSNFETTAASNTVTFGSTTATVTAASATSLTVTTPPLAAGPVNVSVTTGGGTDTLTNGFTYIAAPTVTGVSVPLNGTYSVGSSLGFTVNFDQNVTVNTAGGTPYLSLSIGPNTRAASYLSGSGTTSLTFRYTVEAGDLDTNGLAIDTMSLNGGTIRNGVGGDVSLTLNSVGSTSGVLVDTVAPEVTSITVQGSPAPDATSMTFAVAFSETVNNLDPSDFSLTKTGTAEGTIDSVSAPSGSAITVAINTITGDGTLRLDLNNSVSGIIDAAGNSLAGAFTSGAAHTVLQAPVAADDTLTVAANSTGNVVPLGLSGGTAASVAVATPPSHGTATAAGTTIEYTPTGGYSGTDSFTYTATNAAGTSAPATVTITVTPAVLTLSPTTLTDGVENTPYAEQTLAASGGTGPYSFTLSIGALPDGLDLGTTTGVLSGTPTAHGTFSFTVKATDLYGAIGLADYDLVIAEKAVMAGPVVATVAANSTGNPITLALSGGAASSVAITSAPSHGTATATGTEITYSPTPGYSGSDSFTYTATNGAGTSAPATVTVTVTTPTLVLSPTDLPDGRVGIGYDQAITATAGTTPYSFEVGSGALPAGLTLNTSGGLSGTPTASGAYAFTITATDSLGATGSFAYYLQIEREPNILVFTPASGALPEAMAGEEYSTPITSSGGAAPIIYSIASGALPTGMVLNVSTGELNGPLDAGTEGSYSFTIQATDTNGDTGTASYTLLVAEREITATSREVTVAPGATPTNVNLEDGATGGPFTSANIVAVEPANAGTAQIVMGEFAQAGGPLPVSFYLKFTPNPGYSGQVIVRFTLASSLGTSNPGIVTYNLGYDPVAVAQEVEGLSRDFVQTRQSLIASTVEIPGLLQRRVMAAASDPVSGRLSPTGGGLVLNFATSLAEMNAAASAAAGVIDVGEPSFNLWVNGTLMVHNRAANDNRWGSFWMVSAGADYLLDEKGLVGLSFHYDHMTDPTDPDALLTGNGWLAGPYASFELGEGVFWDSSLLYGGSSNTIDTDFWDGTFDTTRWLLDTAITGQWQLDEVTVLTPRLRAVYLNETVQSYTVENAAGDAIILDGFTSEQLRVSLGAELAQHFVFEDGSALTPKLGVTGGLSGLDGSGAFGSIATGLSWQSPGALNVDGRMLLNIEGSAQTSVGARVGISGQF